MKKVIKYAIILGVITIALSGCGKTSIVGKWAHDSFVYTFNDDKTCSYDVAGSMLYCTYEIEGDKISILYTGNTNAFETPFRIEKDVLYLTDGFGSEITYNKQ